MNTGCEDSLKQLKLKDGVGGVQKLRPADEISEVLPNPIRKHRHIVVECPRTGEFQRTDCHAVFLIERPLSSPSTFS